MTNVGWLSALDRRLVGLAGEVDEEAKDEGIDDLDDGGGELTRSTKDELELECVLESTKQWALAALLKSSVEGFFEPLAHHISAALRVDGPQVHQLQWSLIADGQEWCNPLPSGTAENVGIVLWTDSPLLWYGR